MRSVLKALYIVVAFSGLIFAKGATSETVIIFGFGIAGSAFINQVLDRRDDLNIIIVDPDKDKAQLAKKIFHKLNYIHIIDAIEGIKDSEWQDAIFIMEQIPEIIDNKRNLLASILNKLEDNKNPAPIASSTSSIPLSQLVVNISSPYKHRIAINHPFLPHALAAEIIVPDKSPDSKILAEDIKLFNSSIGIESFILDNSHLEPNDQLGHAFNRIWFKIKEYFIDLYDKEIINPAMGDIAFMQIMGRPLGVFATLDRIGLDTVNKIRNVWYSIDDSTSQSSYQFMNKEDPLAFKFFSPTDKPMDIEWLSSKKEGNLLSLKHYLYEKYKTDNTWENTIENITEEIYSTERKLINKKIDQHMKNLLYQDDVLKLVCYGLTLVIILEYQHTIIRNGVLSIEAMDNLVEVLTGQNNLLSRMHNHLKDKVPTES